MTETESRHILFVLGMHRSGTSAFCAALHACGAVFGDDLLGPMPGVNDNGFWESAKVVAINEQLLNLLGAHWYSIDFPYEDIDWTGTRYQGIRDEALVLLRNGFGDGALEAIKDPRLCLTLPFWLSMCREIGLKSSVCFMSRAPLEICRSLEKRDGFPIGFGLRLLHTYLRCAMRNVPLDVSYLSYERLLENPVGLFSELSRSLPLRVNETELAVSVNKKLNHHASEKDVTFSSLQDYSRIDFDAVEREISDGYPWQSTLNQFAEITVIRGHEITRIGEEHTLALETISDKDANLKRQSRELNKATKVIGNRDKKLLDLNKTLFELGELHRQALDTIETRDAQLSELTQAQSKLGALHRQALDTIEAKDAQLSELTQAQFKLGALHRQALDTIEARDTQLSELTQAQFKLGALHRQALDTIEARDAQLSELTQAQFKLGALHRQALDTIEARDAQLSELTQPQSKVGGQHRQALEISERMDTLPSEIK